LRYWQLTYEELAFHLMDSEVNVGFFEAAMRLVSEGFCLAGSDQPDPCKDIEAHLQLLINGALDAKIKCTKVYALTAW